MSDLPHDALRQQIHRDIQMVLAGHPCDVALAAMIDSLAAMIGVVAVDRQDAEWMIGCLEHDIRRAVDRNWEACREVHAQMIAEAGAGHG